MVADMNGQDRLTLSMAFMTVAASFPLNSNAMSLFFSSSTSVATCWPSMDLGSREARDRHRERMVCGSARTGY